MQSHYTITSTIRYYKVPPTAVELRKVDGEKQAYIDVIAVIPSEVQPFDYSRWKDAPHVALANLREEPEAVLRFTRTYGVLARDYKFGEARSIPVGQVLDLRDDLRAAWEEKTYWPPVTFMEATVRLWPDVAQANLRKGMQIDVKDLGKLIGMIFTRELWEGRLKKCENPDCSAPYFRAVRKGQKFCNQRCAVLINVRHFRERAAKTGKRKNRRGRG